MPQPENWRLLEANGASPTVESGGRYMAFVRDGDIFSRGLTGATARFVHSDEADCQHPAFGADPFVLYFVCGDTAYRYDATGVNALSVAAVAQVTTGGVGRLLTFSDGAVIFIARDDTFKGRAAGVVSPFLYSCWPMLLF